MLEVVDFLYHVSNYLDASMKRFCAMPTPSNKFNNFHICKAGTNVSVAERSDGVEVCGEGSVLSDIACIGAGAWRGVGASCSATENVLWKHSEWFELVDTILM